MKRFLIGSSLVVSCLLFVTYLNQAKAADASLLASPWHITGNNGDAQAYATVNPNILSGQDKIRLTYNLHGLCALGGDASAIIFDQNGWKYVSLSGYGQNCKDGDQTVEIPLSDFKLDLTKPLTGSFHARFWYGKSFTVDISSATLFNSSSSTPAPTPTPTPTPNPTPSLIAGTNLLTAGWNLTANSGSVEKYQTVSPSVLAGNDNLRVTYNLNGLCALGGDASALIFDQNGWKYVPLSTVGQNCKSGDQTVDIPLTKFLGLQALQRHH